MKRDLPRRNEVAMKQSPHSKENDLRYLLIGFAATFIGGIVKVMLMNKFDRPNNPEDDLV